jgi:hypothetical protein
MRSQPLPLTGAPPRNLFMTVFAPILESVTLGLYALMCRQQEGFDMPKVTTGVIGCVIAALLVMGVTKALNLSPTVAFLVGLGGGATGMAVGRRLGKD